MPMSPEAKSALAKTIRSLREYLVGVPGHAEPVGKLQEAADAAYRWSLRPADAGLDEVARARRLRLESWIEEQQRALGSDKTKRTDKSQDFRRDVEKQAAYTLINRLVFLRLLEAQQLRKPPVLTGGWNSRAYLDFRALAPDLAHGDDTEGYAFLLHLVFEDLGMDLPGLYGPAGMADLVPIPAAVLRKVVEALNDPALDSCWTDDMTLGWVYQYYNDPEREALDDKIAGGGKIERHEIAGKTQMFTERYMVDWLLQNSLGPLWLAMCEKNGWTPEVIAFGTMDTLEQRRTDWRNRRARGEVALTELMPLHSDLERRWGYYIPQAISFGAVQSAPDSVRDLKILDPAVGSGHFLVVAFDLLVALYHEEARHRGLVGSLPWTDRAIVERILEHNLCGIDLDPRAVQIAAAALWLKAHTLAPDARPERLNLVATALRLSTLPDHDPALVELRSSVEQEVGIPGALTDTIISALRGADHLGSLLRVDQAVEKAILDHEQATTPRVGPVQGVLFGAPAPQQTLLDFDAATARRTLVQRLEEFLAKHTGGDDLGLRLRGEQLASGVRFVRMVREGTYDVVVANPPYQGASKMADTKYLEQQYPLGKADLFAAFLLRGLELVREGGVSAMLTMRNWMFLKQYSGLREHLLTRHGLRALHDLSSGAFEDISPAQVVVSVASTILRRGVGRCEALSLRVFDDRTVTMPGETQRKRAATLCQEGRHTFDPVAFQVVPEWPLVYWWDDEMLRTYQSAPLFGDVAPARAAQSTGDNPRFTRQIWEVAGLANRFDMYPVAWMPFVNGGKGREWIEELRQVANWAAWGLPVKSSKCYKTGMETCSLASEEYFGKGRGIAFSKIGANFSARVHRYPSIFGDAGSSVFPDDLAGAVCTMNSTRAREILESLNPTVNFQVGDVNRLPLFPIAQADTIFAHIEAAFGIHEAHREPSVEFRQPGPSPWRHAQQWAQQAIDRPEGAPLPEYIEELDPEPPTDHISFALGVALGRFGAPGNAQQGVLDPETADLSQALPHGILFLDTTLDALDPHDGLGQMAALGLHRAWEQHGKDIAPRSSLRTWLAQAFFTDVHVKMYDNRPICWPLSSSKKTFVAWVHIHRMTEQTLTVLLADHLLPTAMRLEGELADLRAARDGADKRAAQLAEKRYDQVVKVQTELAEFIAAVEQCAERGPGPTGAKCPDREVDARYAPDLDDGVMLNAAALWPLLDPQWKKPKSWWTELAMAKGKKDYDWAHLAMRYWPTRVDKKCQSDPSLAVAHGCFWRYHPERAWAWELRLQHEIGPEFRIEEAPYQPGGRDVGDDGDKAHRAAFLREKPKLALEMIEKEAVRRRGRGKDAQPVAELLLLEPGLWTACAAELWEIELRVSQKQGMEFRIVAPDEKEARAAFETAFPQKAAQRRALLDTLELQPDLLPDPVDETPDEETDWEDPDGDPDEDES